MATQRLPVIVGFGGVNSAGRASGHRAYDRIVYSALGQQQQAATLDALGRMMGLKDSADNEQHILDHTLVRRIEKSHFDVDAVRWNQRLPTQSAGLPFNFDVERRHLPEQIPPHWQVESNSVTHVNVSITGEQDFLLSTHREFDVKSAGMLPTGFEPGKLYPARNHPRGLEMTVYAASDALGSIGIEWEQVSRHVAADEVSVYAGSAMGQLDQSGAGGMLKSRYNGQRVSSKFCPFSFAEMPADFINAYVLGSWVLPVQALVPARPFCITCDMASMISAVGGRGLPSLARRRRLSRQRSWKVIPQWALWRRRRVCARSKALGWINRPIRGGPVGPLLIIVASP